MTTRETCVRALRSAAQSWRLGMDAQANEAFLHLVDALTRHLATPAGAASVNDVNVHLGEIIAAQERGDTLAVADLLEFRVEPILRGE